MGQSAAKLHRLAGQRMHEPQVVGVEYLDAEEAYRERLVKKHERGYQALDVMEQHLKRHDSFAGERYSIADIALYAYTHVSHEGGFNLEGYPAIRAWIGRVAGQPRHIPITEVC